jgi:valyl-tRNA synthetase
MSQESKPPDENGAPPVASVVNNPETAEVRIAEPADGGQVDLSRELRGELEGVRVPEEMDPQVRHALDKLRQGTKEGLSSSDHYSLGVAYMGMGLVDDAVREFNAAKIPGKKKPAKKAVKKRAPPKKRTAKARRPTGQKKRGGKATRKRR